MTERVLVVGAGIAGLSAAFRLQQAGFDVQVLEAAERVGGRMSTIEKNGFRIDIAASILPTTYEAMVRLIHDAGLSGEIQPTSDLVGTYRDGRVHRLRSHVRTDALKTNLLSWRAKARMVRVLLDTHRIGDCLDWYDLGRAAPWDTETAREYADRRLDPEILEYVIDAAVGSLHVASPERLSVIDFLFAFRHLLGGAFFNSSTGADFICKGLARHVPVQVSARVTSVEDDDRGVTLTWSRPGEPERVEEAAACVLTGSAPPMLRMYPKLDPARREILERIEYSTCVDVHLGLAKPPVEPAMMVQVPRRAHPDLNVIVLDHNKAPGRAPLGKGLLASYWHTRWGDQVWELDDEAIVQQGIAAISTVLPGIEHDVEMSHVARWRPAVVMSRAGTYRELTELRRATDPGARVQLAGDFLSMTTTNASLCAGEQAARRLSAAFGAQLR